MKPPYLTKLDDLSARQLRQIRLGLHRLLMTTDYYAPGPIRELTRQTEKAIRRKHQEQTRGKVKSPPTRQIANNGMPYHPFLPNSIHEEDLHRPPEVSTAGTQPCQGAKPRLSPTGEPQAVTRLTRRAHNNSPIVAPRRRKKSE